MNTEAVNLDVQPVDQELAFQSALHEMMLSACQGASMAAHETDSFFLKIRVKKARAFTDFITPDEDDDSDSSHMLGHLKLAILMGTHRFTSQPVIAGVEPALDATFSLNLSSLTDGSASAVKLLESTAELRFLLLFCSQGARSWDIVAEGSFDWREVLASAPLSVQVDLMTVQAVPLSLDIPYGILDLEFWITPQLSASLPAHQIGERRSRIKMSEGANWRVFLGYAKGWWRDYLSLHEMHAQALVKLIAVDETGLSRPVTAFLRPLASPLHLHSPHQAARMVSLIPFERNEQLGGGRVEIWHTPSAFLARNKGDVEDHAILLCSLLLGFGLNAYIVLGTDGAGAHVWVMTLDDVGVVFWESLTAVRYAWQSDPHPYETVSCVFNDTGLWANVQGTRSIGEERGGGGGGGGVEGEGERDAVSFALGNPECWKAMDPEMLGLMPRVEAVRLSPPAPMEVLLLEEQRIASELRDFVERDREEAQLSTIWDEGLAYLLTPALRAYEMERETGVAPGNREFQQSIKSYVQKGDLFKGFPVQFNHLRTSIMMETLRQTTGGCEILQLTGHRVHLSLRVKLFSYPENVVACWVMLAGVVKSGPTE